MTMNMPLLLAAALSLLHHVVDGLEARGRADRPSAPACRRLFPGSGGSEKTKTCRPVTSWPSLPWTCGCRSLALRVRWSQGFSAMPAKPLLALPFMPAMMKRNEVSGNEVKTSSIFFANVSHVVDVGVLRRLGDAEQHALVLLGRQLGARVLEQEGEAGQHGDREQRRRRTVVERVPQAPAVPARHGAERAVDRAREAAVLALRGEQQRAHHRREGERHHARDDDRARERERELAEQRAGDAGEEADRRVDGGQRDRHRDHGAGDLARADEGRLERRLALLDVPVDVLDHHDRVVDHEADRQHHGEQRQQVEAEAHRQHQRAGPRRSRAGW